MRITSLTFLFTFMIGGCFFSSCSKEGMDTPPDNPSYKGDFVSSAHTTKGIASIDQDEATLTLTNLKTDSGPDLNIYMASGIMSVTSDFIDLGDIKGVKGSYTYMLPDSVDYSHYKYVVIWCVDFDVNFGFAELEKQ